MEFVAQAKKVKHYWVNLHRAICAKKIEYAPSTGPHHQNVNLEGLSQPLISMLFDMHGCLDLNDLLLCSHRLCPLAVHANNALIRVGVSAFPARGLGLGSATRAQLTGTIIFIGAKGARRKILSTAAY